MAWAQFPVGVHDTFYTPPATIVAILLLCHSFVFCFSEHSRPALEQRALPSTKSDLLSNSTCPQAQHYVKNTFLRSNLKENQTGLPLSIAITVLDTASCAPVENALVEIWGSNSRGAYSGELPGSSNSQAECSSWLRGGLATDVEGTAKFETIYPGPELVRTDWYEDANKRTIDSDTMQYAAALGQIFFPDDLNDKIYKDLNYKDAATKAVKNEADPSYKAEAGSWKAQTEPHVDGSRSDIRAHLTISLNINEPPKIEIGTAPTQCTPGSTNPTDDTPKEDQGSFAPAFQPPIFAIMMVNMMLFYTMYGHGGLSKNQHKENRKSPAPAE